MNKNDIWNFSEINQEHESSITSVNALSMPTTVKYVEDMIVPGAVWADIGGGKFDNVVEFFKNKGASLYIYDPFNRSTEFNMNSVSHIRGGQCDGVMVNNVLNVIDSAQERNRVVLQAFDAAKDGSLVFFKIYEGNKSGVKSTNTRGKSTSTQLNLKTKEYLAEITEVFGQSVHRTGEIIVAKKVLSKELNIQSENAELKKKLKALGIGDRYSKLGVGKLMGDEVYLHKDYAGLIDPHIYESALKLLRENTVNFDFHVVKFNRKTSKVSFISSPDFDSADEPVVGDIVSVDIKESLVSFIKKKKDPQIYHHKWMFVKDDYEGFDVKGSMLRSIQWKSAVGQNKDISSRIGYKSFWQELERNEFKFNLSQKKSTPVCNNGWI